MLGKENITYRRRIEFQMTPDMNWSNIDIDHVKTTCVFDVCNDKEMREAFHWINTERLAKGIHSKVGTKFNLLDYHLQFNKAHEFINRNEERFNEDVD